MRASLFRLTCRMLLVCMICLPFQARAGLVGTVEAASAQEARAVVAGFAARDEVATRMRALGLGPEAVRHRVAALTDAEAAELADRIGSLPAGAEAGTGIVALMVLVFLVYLFWREVIMDGVR